MSYSKLDNCPYQPIHTVEWLEKYLKKNYKKISYNQFRWWRSYKPRKKELHRNKPVLEKIQNGDYDMLSYKYEAELVEHKLRKTWKETYPELEKFLEKSSVDIARRKRLMEDFDKTETDIINTLLKDLSDKFGVDRETIRLDIENSKKSSLYYIYNELKRKYETVTKKN